MLKLKSLANLVAVGLLLACANAYAACTSTLSNSSSNSTTDLIATAVNQCLTNSGTLTGSIESYYSGTISTNSGTLNGGISGFQNNSTIINNGTINIPLNGGAIYTGNGGGGPTFTSIINTGNIIANVSAGNDIYAIWLTNQGVVSSLINSGNIRMDGAGQTVAIFNYDSNTITNLTNSGQISVAGSYAAIANNSVITTLNNSGSIINTGTGHGITNNSNSSIVTINNTGSISAVTPGSVGIVNNSGATIGTLNNAQGGNGLSAATTALTYYGAVPSNYNIIINSATNYGQLSGISLTGSTNFGVFAGSTITTKIYTGVLQGLADSRVGATRTGTYDGMVWTLAIASGTSWDLTFTGASTIGTQSSLHSLAPKLRGAFSSQAIATNFANMNTYDCDLFDEKGVCVSAGGQQTYVDNPSSNMSSTVVVAGYKVSPQIRIGGFLNQSINNNTVAGVHISNANPLMGLFAVWNQKEDRLGYQVKIANAYQDKDVTTTRDVFGLSEAGTGKTNLNTQSYVGELSYAFLANDDKTLVRPYAALRYTRIKQDGYTEQSSAGVTAPLTYAALADRSTTALVGVKLNHKLAEKVNLTGSLGVEQDLDHHVDNLIATGVAGLASENFNDSIKRTRPVASIGAYYMPVKNQRIAADIYYQQLPFQSTGSATAYVNYTIGF